MTHDFMSHTRHMACKEHPHLGHTLSGSFLDACHLPVGSGSFLDVCHLPVGSGSFLGACHHLLGLCAPSFRIAPIDRTAALTLGRMPRCLYIYRIT